MYKLRLITSFLSVLLALYCVAVWAMVYEPKLDVLTLPVTAQAFPFPPLYLCAAFFVVALVVHPGMMDEAASAKKRASS